MFFFKPDVADTTNRHRINPCHSVNWMFTKRSGRVTEWQSFILWSVTLSKEVNQSGFDNKWIGNVKDATLCHILYHQKWKLLNHFCHKTENVNYGGSMFYDLFCFHFCVFLGITRGDFSTNYRKFGLTFLYGYQFPFIEMYEYLFKK